MAAPGPSIKTEESVPNLAESALYAKSRGGGTKGCKGHGRESEEYDWGNTKEREGVCWRCGREGHIAKLCVADMPEDVKRGILEHAHITLFDSGQQDDEELFVCCSEMSRIGGKRKPGRPRKWIGEKGKGEFAW